MSLSYLSLAIESLKADRKIRGLYPFLVSVNREHPIFANIPVGAKHFGSKSLLITNKLSAGMLRPY
ncbi:hypothetical protein QT972_34545, partial [Microcoleus sp. herbarium7]|uniref:hypothetical protein n=1 Tax=unclassified Microcoleus TaxID=2642155 RepID=UPI002FD32FF5